MKNSLHMHNFIIWSSLLYSWQELIALRKNLDGPRIKRFSFKYKLLTYATVPLWKKISVFTAYPFVKSPLT
jgi:hypothetical protein